MAKVKQLGMGAGTFSVALGIGFVMQNGDALASRFGAESAPDQPAPFTQTAPIEAVAAVAEQPEVVEQPVLVAQAGVTAPKAPLTLKQMLPLRLKWTAFRL